MTDAEQREAARQFANKWKGRGREDEDKGMRIVIGGRISTGNYKDKDGKMIYTTDVIVEEHEFAQNKDNSGGENSTGTPKTDKDGFMEAAEGEIPFD